MLIIYTCVLPHQITHHTPSAKTGCADQTIRHTKDYSGSTDSCKIQLYKNLFSHLLYSLDGAMWENV